MTIRIFISLLFMLIGTSIVFDKLSAQRRLLFDTANIDKKIAQDVDKKMAQGNVCPDLTLDVLMSFFNPNKIQNNKTIHPSLLFHLRSTRTISLNWKYYAHGKNMPIVFKGPFTVDEILKRFALSKQTTLNTFKRLVRNAIRDVFEQLKVTLQDYHDRPWWLGTVTDITSDGNITIHQNNPERNLVKGDVFNIFPKHNNPCSPTYNPSEDPIVIARAVLVDQEEYNLTLSPLGLQKPVAVQVGNLAKFSGGNIYNRRSGHYEYERVKMNGKKLIRLGLVQGSLVQFPDHDAPLDTAHFISETILTEAGDSGLIINSSEMTLQYRL